MRFFLSIFAFLLFCFLSPVYPHAILISPKARNGQAIDPGIKIPQPNGPTAAQLLACGGTQGADPGPGPIAATYTAGQSIRVSWDVTIPHSSPPGVRIALKYSDTDSFDKNLIASGVNVDLNKDPVTGIAWTTITLPAGKTSQNAVLQWIWHSTNDGGYYIACSDIRINAADGGGGATTTTAPASTTTPDTETTEAPETTTSESPETTEAPESTTTESGETTEPPITESPEETTSTRLQTTTAKYTGTTSSGSARTSTTTSRFRNPNIGQQQVAPANAATNGRNTVIAFIMASVMAAFMRLFH